MDSSDLSQSSFTLSASIRASADPWYQRPCATPNNLRDLLLHDETERFVITMMYGVHSEAGSHLWSYSLGFQTAIMVTEQHGFFTHIF